MITYFNKYIITKNRAGIKRLRHIFDTGFRAPARNTEEPFLCVRMSKNRTAEAVPSRLIEWGYFAAIAYWYSAQIAFSAAALPS